nr:uncharacterized protein LOC112717240 [Arachis hypogaea]
MVRTSRGEDIALKVKAMLGDPLLISTTRQVGKGEDSECGPEPTRSVFAVNANGAANADPLMRGICLIGDKTLVALFDTGASHLFIAFNKVEELGLKVSELAFDLHVHTQHQKVVAMLDCRQLSKNRVLLDCFERSIQFMLEGENEAVVVEGYYLNFVMIHCNGKECQCYILLAANTLDNNQKLDQISVVRDFPKVFPKDIPKFHGF